MCTAIAMRNSGFYFGRNMDIDYGFGERVIVTPENFPLKLRYEKPIISHSALIGMGSCIDNYPLYAEAANEKGLCMAGLYFPGNASYGREIILDKHNICVFELIPFVLGNCSDVKEAVKLLYRTNIMSTPFREDIPPVPLHWFIADVENSIVLEKTSRGLEIYDDPYDVLTNNPTFDFHLSNAAQYANLDVTPNKGTLGKNARIFGKGLGSFGLPGDFSPGSRFIKSAYLLANSYDGKTVEESVAQFFHILDSVAIVKGSVEDDPKSSYCTTYSCCIDVRDLVYYFKTYNNSSLRCVSMKSENFKGEKLVVISIDSNDFAKQLN